MMEVSIKGHFIIKAILANEWWVNVVFLGGFFWGFFGNYFVEVQKKTNKL